MDRAPGASAVSARRFIVPANVVIHEIGADYALGVHFDAESVEQGVQFRLQR